MLVTPQLIETTAQLSASIHLVVVGRDMPTFMGPAIAELQKVLADQALAPAGPMFSFHHRMPGDTFDFEVGFPTATPVARAGRVHRFEIPASQTLRTTYHGPYEGLAEAWRDFLALVDQSGRTAQACFWESYLAGPETSPDSSTWRTQLNRPVVS
jgi:effector-binding domain-containing protein